MCRVEKNQFRRRASVAQNSLNYMRRIKYDGISTYKLSLSELNAVLNLIPRNTRIIVDTQPHAMVTQQRDVLHVECESYPKAKQLFGGAEPAAGGRG